MKKQSKWAQDLLQKDLVVLDSETSGLTNARFIQLAIIDKHGKTLFNEYFNPGVKIEEGAKAVHGITEEFLANKLPFSHYEQQILDILKDKIIVVYNADFDLQILNIELSQNTFINDYMIDYHCAMKEYAKFYGEKSHRGGYKWQSLTNACIQTGIEVKDAHNALGDCLMTLELIKAMAGQGQQQDTSEIEKLLQRAFAEYGRSEMFLTDSSFLFLTIPNCEVYAKKKGNIIKVKVSNDIVFDSENGIYIAGKWEKLLRLMLE